MLLEDYFTVLAPDDIRIKNHRLGIESVLYEYLHNAQTPEEIIVRFPTLSLDEVYATILYYLLNKKQLDAYMADWLEFSRQSRERQANDPNSPAAKVRQRAAEHASIASFCPKTP